MDRVTLETYLKLVPSAPPFDGKSPTWTPLARVEGLLGLTDTGLAKVRKRLHNAYEHRERGEVFLYFPFWMRAYALEGCDRENKKRRDGSYVMPAFMCSS